MKTKNGIYIALYTICILLFNLSLQAQNDISIVANSDRKVDQKNYTDIIVFKDKREECGEILKYDDGSFRFKTQTGGLRWYSCLSIEDVKSNDKWKVDAFREYKLRQKEMQTLAAEQENKMIKHSLSNTKQNNEIIQENKLEDKQLTINNINQPYNLSLDIRKNIQKDNGEIDFEKGMKYFNQKNYSNALKNFRNAIAKGLDTDSVHYYCGISLYRTKLYNEAIEQLEKALKEKRLNYLIHYDLGEIYYALSNNEKAENEWKSSMQLGNENAEKRLLIYYNSIGKIDKAAELIKEKYGLGG